jgi:ubiquinol-cytochrome c reductase cytochrome c1 subunit
MRGMSLAVVGALFGLLMAVPAMAQENTPPPEVKWSFNGPFGTFDRAAAQRGYQIYHEVCSNCHSLKEAYYRDLSGIGLSPAQIAATAASVNVPTIADDGEPPARPTTVRCRRTCQSSKRRARVEPTIFMASSPAMAMRRRA